MSGGDTSSQSNRYTHNDAAFVEYNTRLQSNNLTTFSTAAAKFTEWLGSDKAYYPNARAPIVSIIESAHVNICRVQGDPSTPFMLNKALPVFDAWHRPYLHLLRQVGSHLNYFDPELRERLQPLIDNAGIEVAMVPTLGENTSTQSKPLPSEERDNDRTTPTAAKEHSTTVDILSQAAGPSTPTQRSKTISPAKISEPRRKGRRKLKKAIFDIDAAAALRAKAQAGHQTIGVNNSPAPELTVQRNATGVTHPPVQLSKGSPEPPLTEQVLNAGGPMKEHPHAQIKDATKDGRMEDVSSPEKATGSEQPQEKSSICLSGEAEPGDNAMFCDHHGQLGPFEAPAADPSPGEVEPSNIDEGLPGPPDAYPGTTSEPMVMESLEHFSVPVPDSEEVGAGERVGTPKRPQDIPGIVEDVGESAPSHSTNDVTIRGATRRKSDDAVGLDQNNISLEPPVKRIRTESEATTVIAPSTPRAATRGPLDPATPTPRSLCIARRIQRSASDMVLESDDEASPPPRPDKGAAGRGTDCDDGPSLSEQQPFAEPQTETLGVESHRAQVTEETMPPIHDLSLASPKFKPNPFTAFKMTLHPPGGRSPFVSSAAIPDFGRLPPHPPVSTSTAGPQVLLQEMPPQKTYVFSAAEIRTLVASRGSDGDSGKLVFYLDWNVIKGITNWRNFKAGQGPLEGSVCLSLACYPVDSVAALMSAAEGNQPLDMLIRRAHIKSSWPSGPTFRSTLKDGSGKSYVIPPFSTTEDNFIDISESGIPGTNTYTIEDNGQKLSNWLFAVYVHSPTIAYFNAIRTRVEKERKWVDALTSFTMYSLPLMDWDAFQPLDPE